VTAIGGIRQNARQRRTATTPEIETLPLALFDLDNTLIGGDSDHLWGRFLVERGVVDGELYARENDRFLRAYEAGELDIHEFLQFALKPLADNAPDDLQRWRREFVSSGILPLVLPAARHLVERHRERGDTLVIVTATNRFVTQPIAELFDIPHLLATEPECVNGRYTGRCEGTPTFREGKILAIEQWLAAREDQLADASFYSDSHNDLPLLERVGRPVAVDPDPTLDAVARERGWPRLTLRAGPEPVTLNG
jgi:HAD superfamily hydrolase (TIGR01490 family)